MLIFPPVPVPKIKGIDPDLLKVISCSKISCSTLRIIVAGDSCYPRQKNFIGNNYDMGRCCHRISFCKTIIKK